MPFSSHVFINVILINTGNKQYMEEYFEEESLTSLRSSTTKVSSSTSLLLHCFQVSFSLPVVSQLNRSMM